MSISDIKILSINGIVLKISMTQIDVLLKLYYF